MLRMYGCMQYYIESYIQVLQTVHGIRKGRDAI